jgi:glycosyltransferase involved in cell wall biosynthesis
MSAPSRDLSGLRRAAAIIPTLNEAGAIAGVVAELIGAGLEEVIVADGASRDGTAAVARAAGARVLDVREPGYGRACAVGSGAASAARDILVFLDGDGADRADLVARLIEPIAAGTHDFVIASRTRGVRERGSMSAHQIWAGRLAGLLMGTLYGVRYTDMCAFRAIRRDALSGLEMREMGYGWNIEMQMLAARKRLRILEVALPYRRRAAGRSKVAGSLVGTLRAGTRIILTCLRVMTSPAPWAPGRPSR